MEQVVNYVESGRPIMGLRTSTHAFNIPFERKYAKYSFDFAGADYLKGFGRQVLGETWVNHHGKHGSPEHAGCHRTGPSAASDCPAALTMVISGGQRTCMASIYRCAMVASRSCWDR